jgi:hypothetical protein
MFEEELHTHIKCNCGIHWCYLCQRILFINDNQEQNFKNKVKMTCDDKNIIANYNKRKIDISNDYNRHTDYWESKYVKRKNVVFQTTIKDINLQSVLKTKKKTTDKKKSSTIYNLFDPQQSNYCPKKIDQIKKIDNLHNIWNIPESENISLWSDEYIIYQWHMQRVKIAMIEITSHIYDLWKKQHILHYCTPETKTILENIWNITYDQNFIN